MSYKEEQTIVKPFQFKQFIIAHDQCAMKVGTDGVLLGAWADVTDAQKILDIGTGTGVIAIMLAQRTTDTLVHGIEIEEAAFQQAKDNMAQCKWTKRLEAIHEPIQDYAKWTDHEYDLIVSNPPFFTGGTLSQNNSRADVRHTIKLPNGDLLMAARKLLSSTGRFCVILPYIEGIRFKERASSYNLHCTKMTEVRPKEDKDVERLLLQFERTAKELVVEELVIQYDARNDYTPAYQALTKDFYLKM